MFDPREQRLAKLLLRVRDQGELSYSAFFRQSLRGYALVMVCAGTIFLAVQQLPAARSPVSNLVLGILVGMVARDIAWFRARRNVWPFNRKVTDWSKVRRIADGETVE